jgi:predicted CXXCH cytochrome family protein
MARQPVFVWRSALVVVLAGASIIVGYASKTRDFHPQHTECQSCHLAARITRENAQQLVESEEKLCGRCHANALQVSHPTGFTPQQKPPAQYPLDWKGDVTCSTCHDVHGQERGLLRGKKRGRAFCLSCHNESFFAGMLDRGTSIQLSGHLARSKAPTSIDLDPYSRQCLSCHADRGDRLDIYVDQRGIVRHTGGSGNHPIGMRYGETKGIGLYRRAADLPAAILLPEGKVSCVSCHVGYSKKHGALVISNKRSALCMECHDI